MLGLIPVKEIQKNLPSSIACLEDRRDDRGWFLCFMVWLDFGNCQEDQDTQKNYSAWTTFSTSCFFPWVSRQAVHFTVLLHLFRSVSWSMERGQFLWRVNYKMEVLMTVIQSLNWWHPLKGRFGDPHEAGSQFQNKQGQRIWWENNWCLLSREESKPIWGK